MCSFQQRLSDWRLLVSNALPLLSKANFSPCNTLTSYIFSTTAPPPDCLLPQANKPCISKGALLLRG